MLWSTSFLLKSFIPSLTHIRWPHILFYIEIVFFPTHFPLSLPQLNTYIITTKMKFSSLIATAILASTALAAPSRDASLDKRKVTMCDSWDSYTDGNYVIYQNLWGESEATSGSQCTYVYGTSSGLLGWSTTWSWAGGSSSVKSYNNVDVIDINKKLSAISSIPSVWTWQWVYSVCVGWWMRRFLYFSL